MKQYKTLIIDDEIKSIQLLSHYIEKFCPNLELLKSTQDFNEGITLIEKLRPDIIFLDILINDNIGFDMLEIINYTKAQVIFISSFEKFAIRAFKYEPVGFLLKPISIKELKDVVNRAILRVKEQQAEKQSIDKDYIAISTSKKIRLVKLKDIMFCESNGNYTFIHLENEEKIFCSGNIGFYENALSKELFLRIHKKYIVNTLFIKAIYRSDRFYCELINGKTLTISRRKQEEIQKQLYKSS